MPYIKKEDRAKFEKAVEALRQASPDSAGELNYLFSMISMIFLAAKGEVRYQALNDVMGALEGAKLEIYRRVIGPHEDLVIKKNGDL